MQKQQEKTQLPSAPTTQLEEIVYNLLEKDEDLAAIFGHLSVQSIYFVSHKHFAEFSKEYRYDYQRIHNRLLCFFCNLNNIIEARKR